MESFWKVSTEKTDYAELSESKTSDVCIVGGGITGIVTAYMLSKSKLDVVLLEADRIGMGVTANTTAKITSQHGLIYAYLKESFDEKTAREYLESNEEAIKIISDIVANEKIDCDFVREDAYVYTCEEKNIVKLKEEQKVLESMDFPAQYVTNISLPFEVKAAIKFPNQAQFHPRKYLLVLLKVLEENNVQIYENTKVVDIKHKEGYYEVHANGCKVKCKYLVMATHYPIKNFPGMYFIKMYQDSSYIIGIEVDEDSFKVNNEQIFDGMYISCDDHITSFRSVTQDNGKKLLLVGGSGHKTGATDVDVDSSYLNLENYVKKLFPKAKVKYRWMTEDCVSLDKVPYIGEFSKFLPNMFVATGYKKWGMTTSHVAAKIISDKILGRQNSYAEIYTATRLKPIKNYKEFGNMLKQSVFSLAINKFSEPNVDFDELENDSGGVVQYNGKKVGVYKDINGKIFAVEPYCRHLGCELSWNNLEKTWDCPCHGSRYDLDGNIITEPTVEKLIKINDVNLKRENS